MKVLLSNDDGIYAQGLRTLYAALQEAGHEVVVFAPCSEQSGKGCSVTAFQPLRASKVEEDSFSGMAVHGTPADSALLGLNALRDSLPDVVFSGINRGPNVGMDVLFSGTVGAAMQAALMHIPAIAFSHAEYHGENSQQARHAVKLLESLDLAAFPKGQVLNVNYPACPLGEAKPMRACTHSLRLNWKCSYEQRQDPYQRPYWWMDNVFSHKTSAEPGSDKTLLAQDHITLTFLAPNFNNDASMNLLQKWVE